MKRLHIVIEDDLDGELERLAIRLRTSKAALVRQFVSERLRPLPPLSGDPIFQMAGTDDFEPSRVDESCIDDLRR